MNNNSIKIRLSTIIATLLAGAFVPTTIPGETSMVPPNIVFILADDLAWTDLGSYGHPWHRTPNIDRLAKDGMRFTNAYAPAPICSASRASLLTGKSVPRVGLEFVVKWEPGKQTINPPQPLEAPPFTMGLPLEEETFAEYLHRAGYDTAYYGKWHLNPHEEVYLGWSPELGPAQQGFIHAIEDFGSHPYSKKDLAVVAQDGKYYSDGLTKNAVSYIKAPHEKPFLLMVSHFYVHTPVKSPYDWLTDQYDKLIPQDIPNREKRIEYAAFVETLDHHVGEVLEALDGTGATNDTLVVFFSDNGGHPEFVANAPLRGSKWNLYEGGIRVPLIARWPEKIVPGTVVDEPVIGYDFLPTFTEVAGAETPEGIDGTSILPIFKSEEKMPKRNLYWHFPYYHPEKAAFGKASELIGVDDFQISKTHPHSAIRRGEYKLIRFAEDERVELYNLSIDLSEENNLAEGRPELAKELQAALEEYLISVDARRALPASESQ